MGARTNGGSGIKVWYVSELPQPKIEKRLRGRGWQVTEIKNGSVLRGLLDRIDQGGMPDVILLGGFLEGNVGALDVLDWLGARPLGEGRKWLVVPFSSDPWTNEYMVESAGKKIEQGRIQGVEMVTILGNEPHLGVFDENKILAVEYEIRAARSGIEGGAAGDARRK